MRMMPMMRANDANDAHLGPGIGTHCSSRLQAGAHDAHAACKCVQMMLMMRTLAPVLGRTAAPGCRLERA